MRAQLAGLAVVAAVLLGAVGPGHGPVAAAAGDGATTETERLREDYCDVWEDFEACYAVDGVLRTTTTPSGNTTYSFTGEECITESYRGRLNYDSCQTIRFRDFDKDGVGQVYHHAVQSDVLFDGERCSGRFLVQFVNGQYRAVISFGHDCEPA